ncbi:hypothetical protein ZWY2020_007065 [Hordeum vulgare]|nr:hypothetical protein ZWY2020_007065 [Hordeum vulgare]
MGGESVGSTAGEAGHPSRHAVTKNRTGAGQGREEDAVSLELGLRLRGSGRRGWRGAEGSNGGSSRSLPAATDRLGSGGNGAANESGGGGIFLPCLSLLVAPTLRAGPRHV